MAMNMGIKPTLSEETVLNLRKCYYYEGMSYAKLGKQFNITPALARKAVQGRGCYEHFQDDIPQSTKDKRKPSYQVHANVN